MSPEDAAPWPAFFPPPAELLRWLNAERRRRQAEGPAALRPLTALRWLVLAEAMRSAPEPRNGAT